MWHFAGYCINTVALQQHIWASEIVKGQLSVYEQEASLCLAESKECL